LRRAANALADSLLQSVFLEMFGDPEQNPKGWDKDEFEKAIISTQNGFGQREDYSPKGIIVLRIRDISSGRIDYSDPRRMIIPEKELAKYSLDHEDLILVRVNGNPNFVGIASEFTAQNEPIVFSDHIIRVKMDRKLLNTTFTVYLLNSPYGRKQTISNISTTAGQFTINSSGLSRIKMIFPPLALQEEFARVAARVEGLRARMAEAERQAEGLFQSLLAEAFS
jgi:type I restriction enzyme S subunit